MSMVDVSEKPTVPREAIARGTIELKPSTIKLIQERKVEKGDIKAIATIAGVLGAKKTSELIPLCHPLPLSSVKLEVNIVNDTQVMVEATVKACAKTGVEMEALTAVSTALLTVWDMTKQYEKDRDGQYPTTMISDVRVLRKLKENE